MISSAICDFQLYAQSMVVITLQNIQWYRWGLRNLLIKEYVKVAYIITQIPHSIIQNGIYCTPNWSDSGICSMPAPETSWATYIWFTEIQSETETGSNWRIILSRLPVNILFTSSALWSQQLGEWQAEMKFFHWWVLACGGSLCALLYFSHCPLPKLLSRLWYFWQFAFSEDH